MSQSDLKDSMTRIQRLALVAGVLLSVVGAGAGLAVPALRDQFFNSYLTAFMLWIGVSLGSLALVALHNLTGGKWGQTIRPTIESAAMTLPLMIVLFLPILAGLHSLYDWTHHAAGANKLVEFKMTYWLNTPMFIGRSVFYLLLWTALAWALARGRKAANPGAGFSGAALLIYGLSVNFATIDWVMSMRHEWYSTIFGFLFMAGQAVNAIAWAIVVFALVWRSAAPRGEAKVEAVAARFQDLGSLSLAFIMLWAYMAFSQYLIIWSANISHETPWYLDRLGGGWKVVAGLLLLLHFAVPFVMLLKRPIKRSPSRLAGVAALLIAMRLVDMIWLIQPNLHGEHPQSPAWGVVLSPVLWLGMGGLWVAVFLQQLKNRPLPVLVEDAAAPAGSAVEVAHG